VANRISGHSVAVVSNDYSKMPFKVVIVGAGVAALEAAFGLRDQCGEDVAVTIVAPDREFVYRPMTVGEPFLYAPARRYPLDEIVADLHAELLSDRVGSVDRDRRILHTQTGQQLHYDALLLAPGARLRPRYRHALTIDDRQLYDQLHGLVQDVEGGYTRRVAFVVPSGKAWPLPIYELALMTATRAYDMCMDVSVTIATPEDAPLAIFGRIVSDGVRALLDEKGIATITSAHCEVPTPRSIEISPGSRHLTADRIIALPELVGPSVPGVGRDAPGGFIPVDPCCRVRGAERVYAAGDATDFAIKHGGVSAQQADVAAQAIAAFAGFGPEPAPFRPVIRGMLLTGGKPCYLSAHITGGHGTSSEFSDTPTWSPATKIAAKYLALYLADLDRGVGSVR
jgi:sulfide:quinone oxidoreductase